MIPDKIRRKKQSLGVLKQTLTMKARRDGHLKGSVVMNTDINSKVSWRMRLADPDQDDEEPRQQGKPPKAPWIFYI